MNKNVIIEIGIIIVLAIVGFGGYYLLSSNEKTKEKEPAPTNTPVEEEEKKEEKEPNEEENKPSTKKGKTLVVYFSASGSTKRVAEEIAKNLNADLFEIIPEEVYTSEDLSWTNENSRVSREHNNESLRNIKLKNTTVENWESYDTVLIGYPIWWGIAAWPVNTFVTSNNFKNKTVIPFCTSASSGLGQSGELLASVANTGNWLEGHRFSSSASSSDIKTWTDRIK